MDIGSFAAAVGIVKTLKDLTASLGDDVPRELREQILALGDKVMEMQTAALEALQRETQLQEELRRVKDWETEKARYIPQNIDQKIVYAQKPEARTHEDVPHWLCARCFEDRKKSYLQGTGPLAGGRRNWTCWRCKAQLSSIPENFVPQ